MMQGRTRVIDDPRRRPCVGFDERAVSPTKAAKTPWRLLLKQTRRVIGR